MNPNLGTGGGVDIDYKKIRQMIVEELNARPYPRQEKIDLSPLAAAIDEVKGEIMLIDIPKPEKINLGALEAGIRSVSDKIDQIVIPEPEKLNLTPVIDKLVVLEKTVEELEVNINGLNKKIVDKIDEAVKEIGNDEETINEIKASVDSHLRGLRLKTFFKGEQPSAPEKKKQQRRFF
jgi:hypothetical protein